eukprot:TRINITY_DN111744_c0_g1_i1.p1 TRINITY_DN111744_c0_g1~~TRINITY_DN111744_c0_g1_i1.p1  ORF type:complete len:243 (+),score=68.85 TRINITY_DN111744_c0_g1_i1:68-796(+)
MAFVKDHGRCCIMLPLKLGVGLIAMFEFFCSLLCILALLTGDIRFQATGYDPSFYHLTTGIGALGLVFSFVGLLGIYDDKTSWLRAYSMFIVVKQIAMGISIFADMLVLRKCEGWTKHYKFEDNPQMYTLAAQGICPWANWAYLIGVSIDFCFNLYLVYITLHYQKMLLMYPTYKVDFGAERHDVSARWRKFQVKNPYADFESLPEMNTDKGGSGNADYASASALIGESIQADAGGYGSTIA